MLPVIFSCVCAQELVCVQTLLFFVSKTYIIDSVIFKTKGTSHLKFCERTSFFMCTRTQLRGNVDFDCSCRFQNFHMNLASCMKHVVRRSRVCPSLYHLFVENRPHYTKAISFIQRPLILRRDLALALVEKFF